MQEVEDRIEAVLPKLSRLGSVVKFDFGADGNLVVDATGPAATVARDSDVDADCTIKITPANLVKLIDGDLDPMLGYTMGKIKVVGSTGVAMKLVGALG